MRRFLSAATGVALALVSAAPVLAGDLADLLMPPEGWTVTIKGNVLTSPEYPGAKSNGIIGYPSGSIRKAGTPASFSTPDDGIGFALFDTGWLKAGPVASFVGARKAKDHPSLAGLRDVDWTIEGGVFAELWPMEQLRMRAELRHGFHGHHGLVADLGADWVVKHGAWTLSAGPRVTLSSKAFMEKYFAVDAAGSVASGLPTFNPGGGFKSVGATVAAKYDWNKAWSTTLWARYDRLTGDAGASPIVKQRGSTNQYTLGGIVAYSFDFKGF